MVVGLAEIAKSSTIRARLTECLRPAAESDAVTVIVHVVNRVFFVVTAWKEDSSRWLARREYYWMISGPVYSDPSWELKEGAVTDAPQTILPENPHSPMTDTPICFVYPLKTWAVAGVPKVKSGVQAELEVTRRMGRNWIVATAKINEAITTDKLFFCRFNSFCM